MDELEKYDFFDMVASPSARKRSFPFSPSVSNASGLDPSETDDADSNHGSNQLQTGGQCWKHARQNHSQIEKRRRDKMNMHINELAALVPMCSAMAKKLDKLTVLRMVVQYVKTVRGAVHSYTEGTYKPSFVTDAELRSLLLRIADGFVFVVGCDRGKLLFVSESVTSVLGYPRSELLGQSWFDILHPKDIQKMKEQLASSDLNPRERFIDSKTMLPVKTEASHSNQGTGGLCPGARRAFFCRMRAKDAEVRQNRNQKRFNVVRCVGYLKAWTPIDDEEGSSNMSCLVAVGRVMPPPSAHSMPLTTRTDASSVIQNSSQQPPKTGLSFCSRHSLDGKYVYVDPTITYILGYLPQEVVGLNLSDFHHPDDAASLADIHRRALNEPSGVLSPAYRFKAKDGFHHFFQTHFKAFRNPWTKDTEFIIARNFLPFKEGENPFGSAPNLEFACDSIGMGTEMTNPCVSMSSCCDAQPQQQQQGILTPTLEDTVIQQQPPLLPVHRPSLQDAAGCSSAPTQRSPVDLVGEVETPEIHTDLPPSGSSVDNEGNDEAAMAVIMRLLEVDAGLGGPVDYSGLPWPLT
ncbi:unnamed protein product [Notodromas monacha]|uniref:Uncharacterized protein n=1 Tax=Notodromas monacha TaxID=399045 RepID=A0A7R9BEX8_9CRUS|nr:unnamed protein product [Notodromas monacha]CAG0913238.1 unnamed protein product [Notodromas monacha]